MVETVFQGVKPSLRMRAAMRQLLNRRFDIFMDQDRQSQCRVLFNIKTPEWQFDLIRFEGEGGALAQLDKDWPL